MVYSSDNSLEQRLKEAERAEVELARLKPWPKQPPNCERPRPRLRSTRNGQGRETLPWKRPRGPLPPLRKNRNGCPSIWKSPPRPLRNSTPSSRNRPPPPSRRPFPRLGRPGDYDIEVEESEAREVSMDRDPRGLAYVLAARHGENKVTQLLDELDPGFEYLRIAIWRTLLTAIWPSSYSATPSTVLRQPPSPALQGNPKPSGLNPRSPPSLPSLRLNQRPQWPSALRRLRPSPVPPEDPRGPLSDPRRRAEPLSPPAEPASAPGLIRLFQTGGRA